MPAFTRKLWAALTDLLYPPACQLCQAPLPGERQLLLCPACHPRLSLLQSPLCTRCGKPFFKAAGSDHLCGACLTSPPAYHRARAILLYAEPAASLIHRLKYRRDTTALATFHSLGHESGVLAQLAEPDLILPVPLHPHRLRQRGFNQALLLARHLLPHWRRCIVADLLERRLDTPAQTSLSGTARRRNLRNAFVLKKGGGERIKQRRILLVDDVFTTGTTINECARILRAAGAERVEALTLARVAD